MKKLNLNDVEESKDFEKVTPGGYVCGITAVEDVPSKEYLRLEYDIAEGPLKNYYRNLYNSMGFWGANFIKSYKDKALPFFKSFTVALEQSNPGYHWDNDETKLKRKLIGLVLGEEEYLSNKDNTVKTRLYVAKVTSIDKIRKGDYKVPEKKLYQGARPDSNPATSSDDVEIDDGVPF